MKKNKKRIKIKYRSFVILLGVVLVVGSLISFSFANSKENKKDINDDFLGMIASDVLTLCEEQDLNCSLVYEFSNTISKDTVINYKKKGENYSVIVSKGKITKDILEEKRVNELGKVPIMMYHGIINQEETEYTGGNVDKDGYNRTSKAFREDLEFYYQNGYRMVRLIDYVSGKIDVELGLSPIVLTFDDGNQNNFNVLGRDKNGELIIDPDCAVGILEEFKKKYPDFQVTATFFLMDGLFNQKEYNEEIMKWLVKNGYDIGNHTTNHADFTKIDIQKTQEVVAKMYIKLAGILGDDYVPIVALPYGSPYKKEHNNYPYILKGSYENFKYETVAALRVGWDSELSPFNKNFDKTFLKRCRAYDNNGVEFDIEMVFKNLASTRYISDGDKNTITIKEENANNLGTNLNKEIIKY